jgi:hypothetical protein
MDKILITGTGRSGTTFLIRLFTFLGYDTGFTRDNYMHHIAPNCNSGMEYPYTAPYYILKNPEFIANIETIINSNELNIKLIIIPIRNYSESANSRNNHGALVCGGLWNAHDFDSQLNYYYKIMSNYIHSMVKHNIPTLFLDFNAMTQNKKYLYDKLKPVLDEKNILFDTFSNVYDEVTILSKPK